SSRRSPPLPTKRSRRCSNASQPRAAPKSACVSTPSASAASRAASALSSQYLTTAHEPTGLHKRWHPANHRPPPLDACGKPGRSGDVYIGATRQGGEVSKVRRVGAVAVLAAIAATVAA